MTPSPRQKPLKKKEAGLFAGGAAGAGIYILGQLFNFGFQLLLIETLGKEIYGRVGLAHLLLIMTIFIGDLGYGLHFLRENPEGEAWQRQWRLAYGHRLVLMLTLPAAVLLFWAIRYGTGGPGFFYLAAAVPGAFFSLFNFSAPLIACGRRRTGFLLQQIAWPTSAMLFLVVFLAVDLPPRALALAAGLCISAGYLVQAAVNLAVLRFKGILTPAFSREGLPLLAISAKLALLGIIGALHDRLTPFLMETVAVDYLPAYLILLQALAGASGVMSQLYRLLVARESAGASSLDPITILIALLLAGTSMLFIVTGIFCREGCGPAPPEWIRFSLIVLLSWVVVTVGGLLASVIIGRRRETGLVRLYLFGMAVSVILQIIAYTFSSAEGLLWGRLIGCAVVVLLAYRLLNISPPWTLAPLALAVFVMADPTILPFGLEVALVALLTVAGLETRRFVRAFMAAYKERHLEREITSCVE